MICTIRIPDVLQARIDNAAGGDGRSKWILDACRMRLDGGRSSAVEDVLGTHQRKAGETTAVEGSNPSPTIKPDMQALREICAGKIPCKHGDPHCPCPDGDPCHYEATETTPAMEIPICGKTWWEDGTQYECLMDKGHRDHKHGLRGMVRRLED
jgi:hypothetical protein